MSIATCRFSVRIGLNATKVCQPSREGSTRDTICKLYLIRLDMYISAICGTREEEVIFEG